MTQADPPKEASTFERMNGRPQLLFSNKMTHYFIEWTSGPSGLLKNILPLQKICCFKQILLIVAAPKNYSTPKEN